MSEGYPDQEESHSSVLVHVLSEHHLHPADGGLHGLARLIKLLNGSHYLR
jgi:hypothetical protein